MLQAKVVQLSLALRHLLLSCATVTTGALVASLSERRHPAIDDRRSRVGRQLGTCAALQANFILALDTACESARRYPRDL